MVRNVASEVFPARSQNSRPCRQGKKKTKRKIPSFSPPSLESRTLDLVTPRGWLLGYFLLPIFTSSGGKRKKRGGSRTFLFFSPAECRNAENERRSIAGPIQGAHLPVMAPAAITKREFRKKITIKRERERKTFE